MREGLSNPDKRLWPQFTKADLWDYYSQVADRMLPHVAGRPLTFKRFPDGVDGEGFIQKNLPASAPEHVGRFRDWSESSRREVTYAIASSVEDLQWLAQMAALEVHPWFSRTDRAERADLLAFDLDPSDPSQSVVQAAHWLREVLDTLDLVALVKTSGKRGLHLYVPVERRYTFSELRGFALAVSRACADRHPGALTVEMRKADRGGRLLLDWSRNGRAQTLVAPWSPRATQAATVSVPLDWSEVGRDLDVGAFTLATVRDRGDPWTNSPPPQRLERARHALAAAGYPSEDVSPRARTTPR